MTEEIDGIDEVKPETEQEKNTGKTLSQEEVNKLIAAEKRTWQKKLEAVQNEYTTYKTDVEAKLQAEENKLKTVVDEAKKTLPANIVKLLDKLTVTEAYEWLNDPENATDKKSLPDTPQGKGEVKTNLSLAKIKF